MFSDKRKIAVASVTALLCGALMVMIVAYGISWVRTISLNDDYATLLTEKPYSESVSISGIKAKGQYESSSYAIIEMFSDWQARTKGVQAQQGDHSNMMISTTSSFASEMNTRFPRYHTRAYGYLTHSELLKKTHESLSRGIPVPIEWADRYHDGEEESWRFHYSLVVGMDLSQNRILVANPSGQIEEVAVQDFLDRTSFEVYEKKPIWLELAFAFGILEKNTVFITTER